VAEQLDPAKVAGTIVPWRCTRCDWPLAVTVEIDHKFRLRLYDFSGHAQVVLAAEIKCPRCGADRRFSAMPVPE
jgi:phage FluMu protein Com